MPNSQTTSQPHIILGLDYGVKKMGVALGNTLTLDARPLAIITMNNGQPRLLSAYRSIWTIANRMYPRGQASLHGDWLIN